MENNYYFTKEMRNQLYKAAYASYLESVKSDTNFGICKELRNVMHEFKYKGLIIDSKWDNSNELILERVDPYVSLVEFPELFLCRPIKHNSRISPFWFVLDDIQSRISIFEKIINLTN